MGMFSSATVERSSTDRQGSRNEEDNWLHAIDGFMVENIAELGTCFLMGACESFNREWCLKEDQDGTIPSAERFKFNITGDQADRVGFLFDALTEYV